MISFLPIACSHDNQGDILDNYVNYFKNTKTSSRNRAISAFQIGHHVAYFPKIHKQRKLKYIRLLSQYLKKDKSPEVKQKICFAFIEIARSKNSTEIKEEMVDSLVIASKDKNIKVRRSTIKALLALAVNCNSKLSLAAKKNMLKAAKAASKDSDYWVKNYANDILKILLVYPAKNILTGVLKIKSNEKIFIIYDDDKATVAESFIKAAKLLGLSIKSFKLGPDRFENGGIEKLLKKVSESLKKDGPHVFINTFAGKKTKSGGSEAPFRIKLIGSQVGKKKLYPEIDKNIIDIGKKCRVMHSPGITAEMLLWKADYKQMAARVAKIDKALKNAASVIIKTSSGTRLTLKVHDRPTHGELTIEKPGIFKNFPVGEIYLSPHEDLTEGVAIVDGTIGDLGIPPKPIKVVFKKGKVIDVKYLHKNPTATELQYLKGLNKALAKDQEASVIGELGFGVADYPMVGEMLGDEKIFGTVHIATGYNAHVNGKNNSRTHIDMIMKKPSITITYKDSSAKVMMWQGKLQ